MVGQGVEIAGLIGLWPALVDSQLQAVDTRLTCLCHQFFRGLPPEVMGAGTYFKFVHKYPLGSQGRLVATVVLAASRDLEWKA